MLSDIRPGYASCMQSVLFWFLRLKQAAFWNCRRYRCRTQILHLSVSCRIVNLIGWFAGAVRSNWSSCRLVILLACHRYSRLLNMVSWCLCLCICIARYLSIYLWHSCRYCVETAEHITELFHTWNFVAHHSVFRTQKFRRRHSKWGRVIQIGI